VAGADGESSGARRGPIFIIGPMGSGTTLLRLMLDSHPRIAIPQETGFMRAASANRMIPFKWSGPGWYRRLGWTDKEFVQLQRDFYDTVLSRYAEQHGKDRWGEKTPLHTWHVDRIVKMFPDAKFVGIVRHPGGSVASNRRRFRDSHGRAVYHYERYATELARQAIRRWRRFRVLRYEDLVLQPEPLMRELLDWLGEPWADEVLRHDAVQATRGGKLQVEGRVRVDDAIDKARISKWTQELSEAELAKMRRHLGLLSELFGYSIDDPLALEPLRRDGKLLARGGDLKRRAAAIPDLDVETRPPVPIFERRYHPRELTLTEARPKSRKTNQEEAPAPPPSVPSRARRALAPVVERLKPAGRDGKG
jgi:hypothetical protein